MVSFRERWLAAVEENDSVLCVGLDPAEFSMGRGAEGLPPGTNKREWALRYVEAVAPYCAAVKPNFQYWKGEDDVAALKEIRDLARSLHLMVIDDSKLADIGPTNGAGVFYASQRADAVTIAPYAGNIGECVEQGKKFGVGIITMCLMSNPEYETQKNKLVPVYEDYLEEDIVRVGDQPHVRQFMVNAHEAKFAGLAGMVIGAPSKKNHLTDEELAKARHYSGDQVLILLPGVGAQGGEAAKIWQHYPSDGVIVNVGRKLMFPNGSTSGVDDWKAAAQEYQKMLNEKRNAV